MKAHPSPRPSPLRGERETLNAPVVLPASDLPAAPIPSSLRREKATGSVPTLSPALDSPAAPIPSPLGGERVRVRGAHRTRTTAARDFSRELRKKSTDAEKRLWRLLRDRRFNGFKFRRQYPCGIYFLDFFCVEARLSVELDGGGHGFPEQRQHDEERERFLAAQGIKTLRFWNHQLRGQLEAIRFEIWYALMERTGRAKEIAAFLPKSHPSPQPSPLRGERETERAVTKDAACGPQGARPNSLSPRTTKGLADPASLSPPRGEGQGEGCIPKCQSGITKPAQHRQ